MQLTTSRIEYSKITHEAVAMPKPIKKINVVTYMGCLE